MVGLNPMVVVPGVTGTVTVVVTHVVHAPVGAKGTVCVDVPFTRTAAGRAVVEPLANRTSSVAVPAAEVVTVSRTAAPTALSPLQNPVPEYPAWFASIVPVHTTGAVSASYRLGAAVAMVAPSPMRTVVIVTTPMTARRFMSLLGSLRCTGRESAGAVA